MAKLFLLILGVTLFKGDYLSLNFFGLGGVNVHTILQSNKKEITKILLQLLMTYEVLFKFAVEPEKEFNSRLNILKKKKLK